jgi:hypothetical protein
MELIVIPLRNIVLVLAAAMHRMLAGPEAVFNAGDTKKNG